MYINTFRYKPEDVDCNLCTEYKAKTGCTACGCPWLAERIEAGVVSYNDAVAETFAGHPALRFRLNLLGRLYPGTLWQNDAHRQRMESMKARLGYRRQRDTPAFYAAMYLLTSGESIYKCAANCLYKKGFDHSYARLRGISPHDYTLFMAARGLCTDADGLTIADLADAEVVDPEAFTLIVNAILIARYGLVAFSLEKGRS